jgi:uncharacterized protein
MDSQSIHRRKNGLFRAAGVGVGLTVLAVIFSTIFGILVAVPLFVIGLTIENTAVLVSLLLGGQVGFFAAGYLYARRYGLTVSLARPERRDLKYAGAGIVAALVFATGAGIVLTGLGFTPDAVLEEIVTQNPMVAIWLIVLSIVVVAPVEEYLFRGIIQTRLRKTFRAPTAIVIASALFGSVHLGNYLGSIGAVVGWTLLITGVGVVMGVLYERTILWCQSSHIRYTTWYYSQLDILCCKLSCLTSLILSFLARKSRRYGGEE